MDTLEEKHQPEQGHAPLFVVGMWRSGTSLFYALLNQHPQIKLMYEDELPLLWPLFLGSSAKRDWPERWEFWNQALSRHKLNPEDLPREVSGLREACEATWAQYAPDADIRGGKSPSYFDCLPRIAAEFPNAKFLVMWRDPADVCRSVVRARSDSFFAKRGMVLRALLGCRDLKAGYDTLVARGAQVYPVQYEDLVTNPAAVMQGVCSFLEIDFNPRMASLKGADRSAIYDGGHHEGVNSEKIAAAKKAEVLPEDIRHKVACYIAHWKRESGGSWPRYPQSEQKASIGTMFFFERTVDRIVYRALRTFDQFVALLYSYLPIGILRKYRASKGRAAAEAPAPKPVTEKELVGASQKH
jgi:hypothetical protein